MPGNTFGNIFKLTTYGESHGAAIGGVVDGCPPGFPIDRSFISEQLDRRRPGQSPIVSQRKESDEVEFLSGLKDGMTTGTSIGFMIRNKGAKGKDYDHLKDVYRPSHADHTYEVKYGIRDHEGGGRASARETANWVVGGSVAQCILEKIGVNPLAYVSSVGSIALDKEVNDVDRAFVDSNPVRCPDSEVAEKMEERIREIRKKGDTLGGTITCVVKGVPKGLGEPVFQKLDAELAHAMMSINAVKGVEMGSGFQGTRMLGSEHNDPFVKNEKGKTVTSKNDSGGVQGGISNGMDLVLRVAFKPVATIMKDQTTLDKDGAQVELEGKGRHDPCVVPRAVPIVESMASMVILDALLFQKGREAIVSEFNSTSQAKK